jgi:hypothetical protein
MKKLLALFAFLLVHSASATLYYSDIVGTWKGTRVEYFGGKAYKGTSTLQLRKYGNGGISQRSVITFPGLGSIYGQTYLYANGKSEGTATFQGQVVIISSGTWSIRGRTIYARQHIRDLNGTYNSTATLRFVGRNTLVSIASTSNGGKITNTLRRQ